MNFPHSRLFEAAVADPPAGTGTGSGAASGAGAGTGSGSAATSPYYSDFLQSDGLLNHKALDRLPDHLKELRPTLEKQKDMDSLLGALNHYQSLAGKKALAPLAPNAPKEVLAERKALLDGLNSVPKEAKDYGIVKPADLPDAAWNPKMAEGFASWAQKNSVSPTAVKELLGLNISLAKEQLAAQDGYAQQFWAGQQKTFESVLKTENIPADRAQALIEKGALALGLDMEDAQTKELMKGSTARLMAMRHAVAIGEDKVETGTGGGQEARDPGAEALDIQRNPANPEYAVYRNKDNAFSRTAVDAVKAKVNRLFEMAEQKRAAANKRR